MSDFARKRDGERFQFLGMKTNSSPDSMPPGKYPYALNIREYSANSVRTRPGQAPRFSTVGVGRVITDIRAYSVLSTDNLPRILVRDSLDAIWLDNGVSVGALGGVGIRGLGVSMIPLRPNQSPNPWMYIASGNDYQKFSAPSGSNVVTQRKVGIAEPQTPPDAAPSQQFQSYIGFPVGPGYTLAGTAGAGGTATRSSDTVTAVFPDPAGGIFSLQVSSSVQYQRQQVILIQGATFVIQDVFPPLPTTALTISSITYFSGTTGRCVIVPAGLVSTAGTGGQSLLSEVLLASLRRGALVMIGAEVVFVLSATAGPDGTISFETSTVNPHTSADTLTGVAAISVFAGAAAGQTISGLDNTFQVTAGIGMATITLGSNPFVITGTSFQAEDYIHVSMNIDNLLNLTEFKILFDVGDGSFTQNFYYYTVRPSDVVAGVANTLTQLAAAQTVTQRAIIDSENAAASKNQLQTASSAQTSPGSSQWSEIIFPIGALTRVGNDETKTLQNVTKVQLLFNASGTINVATSSFTIFGTFSPDVGAVGAPYLYRVRPRSSITGVRGNPSPATRYGINPRRQKVTVTLPSAAYDSQIDTWDVFRYGGSVTSWRYIGSTPSTNSTFTDNYDDSAATVGEALDFDNFEPWPSIDVPLNVTATTVTGTIAAVTVPPGTNVLRFLPGNLVRIGGRNVYTLWARPTLISGTSYLFQFVENAGAGTNLAVSIYEPALAQQLLPYMWGPDASGTIFAVGDPLRLGTLYFAKNYAPDSAPDAYNLEISVPSEPLLGGEVLDGLSLVASTERWWALFPQPQDVRQRYSIVQQPFARGLAAPYGHCNDGVSVYWWAKDGIYSSTQGSLTDADLYNLFPHEGVKGETVTIAGGYTLTPPDYSRAGTFRLAFDSGYLYASYQDSTGAYVNLVCRVATAAWRVDAYAVPVSVFYKPEQQAGTLLTNTTLYDRLLMGNTSGWVSAQLDRADDINASGVATSAISCVVTTREDDGGDVRAPKQWGDLFLDATPASATGLVVALLSQNSLVATLPTLATAATRTRQPLSVSTAGPIVSEFLGIQLRWSDDFATQSVPTTLYIWQPSFDVQPARDIEWFTFGTTFGLDGYHHLRQIALAWVSTAPITLTITSYDGLSPAAITIPSSGGAYKKQLFPVGANKGLLHNFHAVSAAPFQVFLADSEFYVGQWGRTGAYLAAKSLGERDVEPAII